ncbi:hypothetical protein J5X84_03295 [Streptosporangiaceae bacterium NEAU-GS5]|nr:hypothetical protein [Streptosporangiaceae bacterium NEAU-GS5]
MFKIDAGRLREPAAWTMVAVGATSVLIGIARLLISDSSLTGTFGVRASMGFTTFVSPVMGALAVGAVVLVTRFGPGTPRARLVILTAGGTLAVGVLFGVVSLLATMAADSLSFRDKFEFLITGAPLLALAGVALLYVASHVTPAVSPAPRAKGAVAPEVAGPMYASFQQPMPAAPQSMASEPVPPPYQPPFEPVLYGRQPVEPAPPPVASVPPVAVAPEPGVVQPIPGYEQPPAAYEPPAYEAPSYEQPVAYEQPAYEQPVYEQPVPYEQPAYEQPAYEPYAGSPFSGYSSSEYARRADALDPLNTNTPLEAYDYPPPTYDNSSYDSSYDKADPREQQLAQAYQQAQSYRQQTDVYGSSPLGHPQTPNPSPGPAYQSESFSGPQPIDPTAIYAPDRPDRSERTARVNPEESAGKEHVGQGADSGAHWYGADPLER